MSPLVTLPYDLTDGVDLALGSEVMANLQSVIDVIHALNYENLAPFPNFPGTCIDSTPGRRIPESRIENDAVTADKLRDAALDVDDLQRAVTSDHIRLQAVRKKHLEDDAITFTQMDFGLTQTLAIPTPNTLVGSGRGVLLERRSSGGNWVFEVLRDDALTTANLVPPTPIPTATHVIIGLYFADLVIVGSQLSGSVVVIALKLS